MNSKFNEICEAVIKKRLDYDFIFETVNYLIGIIGSSKRTTSTEFSKILLNETDITKEELTDLINTLEKISKLEKKITK